MKRTKLKEVTFCLGDEPIKSLLWCDKTPRGKRTKVVKLNGVPINEVPHNPLQNG